MAFSPAFLKRRGIRPEPLQTEFEDATSFAALVFEDRHHEITFFCNGAWGCPEPTGYANGRTAEIIMIGEDGVSHALTWPGSFVWLEGALVTLPVNKRAIVSIRCMFGVYLASYVLES